MCGIAGFSNVPQEKRSFLVLALGIGTDTRGKHAAGYVSPAVGRTHYGRKPGPWESASPAFIHDASQGDLTLIHSRYATCGGTDDRSKIENAHPFSIKRPLHDPSRAGGSLWGMHNGMIYNAHASAVKHRRKLTVDSREVFELLADGRLDEIRQLEGYGVLAWIERSARDRVRLVKVSPGGDLVVAETVEGCLVWGSTKSIVEDGLELAGMGAIRHTYEIKPGQVVEAHKDGRLTESAVYAEAITFSECKFTRYSIGSAWQPTTWTPLHPRPSTFDWAEWRKKEAEREGRTRTATSTVEAHGGTFRDEGGDRVRISYADDVQNTRTFGYLAGADLDDDSADDDPGDCPKCGSYDTWMLGFFAQCADCGQTWEMGPPEMSEPYSDDVANTADASNAALASGEGFYEADLDDESWAKIRAEWRAKGAERDAQAAEAKDAEAKETARHALALRSLYGGE